MWGITPRVAAKATIPDPAGKLIPIGNLVWLSPPVPTVSGSNILLSHEWMMPSPGLKEMPPRLIKKSGSVLWVISSTGFGYAAVWQNDCINKSLKNQDMPVL